MKYTYQELTSTQIRKYLERIHFSSIPDNSLECLNKLIYSHQLSIPFENLDVYYEQLPLSLAVNDLFDKIITNKQGGYCFELNGLFISLLRSLGFHAWSCFCRVVRGQELVRPISHRGNLILLDHQLYFCDVGFGGPMASGAILLKDGLWQEIKADYFKPVKDECGWWEIHRRTKGIHDIYNQDAKEKEQCELIISETVCDPLDFIPLSDSSSLRKEAIFRQMPMVNLKTPDGFLSITGNKFTKVKNQQRTEINISSKEEFYITLQSEFHLTVPIN